MSTRTKISLILLPILLVSIIGVFFPGYISNIRTGITIKQSQSDSLILLTKFALKHGDYDIGALITYKDTIIGAGYNTSHDMNDPFGHAEINAIESVFETMDYQQFKALNRDSLVLITSYEPCMMCKGVINHFDIRKIYYVKPKKSRFRLYYQLKSISYYLNLRKIKTPEN